MINKKRISNRIKECRKEKGWSQDVLAEKLNCIRQTISNWERENLNLTIDDLINLCNVFDCDIGYLIGEYETKKHIAADIQKETGLSEKAIEILKSNKSYSPNNSLISTINFLIECEMPLDKIGDFTLHDSKALLRKINMFFSTKQIEKSYVVTEQGLLKLIEHPSDMRNSQNIIEGESIFSSTTLSEISEMLKNLKIEYKIKQYKQNKNKKTKEDIKNGND